MNFKKIRIIKKVYELGKSMQILKKYTNFKKVHVFEKSNRI